MIVLPGGSVVGALDCDKKAAGANPIPTQEPFSTPLVFHCAVSDNLLKVTISLGNAQQRAF